MPPTCILVSGHTVTIDSEDLDRVAGIQWRLGGPPGRQRVVSTKMKPSIQLAQFILNAPKKHVVYQNGNVLDCRRENLHPRTQASLAPSETTPQKHRYDERLGCTILLLGQGVEALIDTEDYPRVGHCHWYINPYGYVEGSVRDDNGGWTRVLLHRVILGLAKGGGRPTHHLYGNKLDNRKSQLQVMSGHREHTTIGNISRPPTSRNRTGFKGVHKATRSRWRASLVIEGKDTYLGLFSDPAAAARAYDQAAWANYGQLAYLNFPELVTPATTCG